MQLVQSDQLRVQLTACCLCSTVLDSSSYPLTAAARVCGSPNPNSHKPNPDIMSLFGSRPSGGKVYSVNSRIARFWRV